MKNVDKIVLTGFIGLIASLLVGAGEFLLHFDSLGRFASEKPYEFMQGISTSRTTLGHFIGVFAAPLYLFGFWHLSKMLEPANKIASKIAFFVMSYGIIMGVIWIGSRSGISAIINDNAIGNSSSWQALYELRYESLLQVTRLAVLLFSGIFIWLILTGKTMYPRWMALLNPILLIIGSFVVWMIIPGIGIYLMPIALNVAFFILFSFSIYFSKQIKE